jgi:hypothetical protein
MASEDSDHLGPGLSAIHRLRNLDDLEQAGRREMALGDDQANTGREFLKISLFH